jgi:hypothetical protein
VSSEAMVNLASRNAIPAAYSTRDFAEAGAPL